MKNKALKLEQYRAGIISFDTCSSFIGKPERNPLSFANSDEFRKMKNRKKK